MQLVGRGQDSVGAQTQGLMHAKYFCTVDLYSQAMKNTL